MRYLSLCSGIESATVAWHPLGWKPTAFGEIERFPSAVLAHHYPNTPNLGDMTKHEQWQLGPGSIDLLVAGTPCQSFSVAGLRRGLADPRGNLALTYLAIADRLRPRWLVWENVPGVLSSSGGRDFGAFLGALGELGYGFAYRVLDAQWFGVAQRRRRVFVVGHLGDWRRAAAVLFERESLRGHPAPSRAARQGAAADVAPSLVSSGRGVERTGESRGQDPVVATWRDGTDRASTLTRKGCDDRMPDKERLFAVLEPIAVPYDLFQITAPVNRQSRKPGDPCHTLARDNAAHAAVAFHPTQDPISSTESVHALGCGSKGGCATAAVACVTGDRTHALTTRCAAAEEDGTGRGTPIVPAAVAFTRCDDGRDATEDKTPTMRCGSNYSAHLAVAIAPTLTAANDPSRSPQSSEITQQVAAVHATTMAVRRLTPVECERLQGFPDGYTAIPWRGKGAEDCPDGPRYRALGNSMAVPCMRWIGERIAQVEALSISVTGDANVQ